VKTTDGCSFFPDFGAKHCCAEHDFYYRNDVGLTTREADTILRKCVQAKGGPFYWALGWIMYAGVRVYSKKLDETRKFKWFK